MFSQYSKIIICNYCCLKMQLQYWDSVNNVTDYKFTIQPYRKIVLTIKLSFESKTLMRENKSRTDFRSGILRTDPTRLTNKRDLISVLEVARIASEQYRYQYEV